MGKKVKKSTHWLMGVVAILWATASFADNYSSTAIASIAPPLADQSMAINQAKQTLQAVLPAGSRLYYLPTLAQLYADRHMQLMWQDKAALHAFKIQLAAMSLTDLQPQFAQWADSIAQNKATDPLAQDVLLSDALLGYLHFVSHFPLPAKSWIYGKHPYPLALPNQQWITRWQQAINANQLAHFIASLAPQNPMYSPMEKLLVAGLQTDSADWDPLNLGKTLRPGDNNAAIPLLRDMLIKYGYLQARVPNILATNNQESKQQISEFNQNYSADLVAAVKQFQQRKGLPADGIIGPDTLRQLNVSPGMRLSLLALNMQRLRLLPDKIDNAIIVNIPDYQLFYFKDGQQVLNSRVVVGRTDRQTPLMWSSLKDVVLNPPWNVPDSITSKELIPKAQANPGYLVKNRYNVYSSWGADAKKLNPYSINWHAANARAYHIQQEAGSYSALGRYKFNFPNSDAVYLHDTPAKSLFANDLRALSHGCVRVHKAAQLADMLITDTGRSQAWIDEVMKTTKTTYIPIKRPILVNLYYLTAWVDEQGNPQFRTDIYGYDKGIFTSQRDLLDAQRLVQ